MTVDVIRQADGARHTLEWGAFRPPVLLVGAQTAPTEMPAGFMLQTTTPRRFNFLFFDLAVQAAVKSATEALTNQWKTSIQADNVQPEARAAYYAQTTMPSRVHVDAFAALDRLIYWDPGEYEYRMKIHTTRPAHDFEHTGRFTLTAQDSATLSANRMGILASACDQPATWGFASAPYRA